VTRPKLELQLKYKENRLIDVLTMKAFGCTEASVQPSALAIFIIFLFCNIEMGFLKDNSIRIQINTQLQAL